MKVRSFRTLTGETVELERFTVLVGPNNVGKSRTLRDLEAKVQGQAPPVTIIDTVEVDLGPTFEAATQGLEWQPVPGNPAIHEVRGIGSNLSGSQGIQVDRSSLEQQFATRQQEDFLRVVGQFRVALLDASARLTVVQSTGSFVPHNQPASNVLQALYQDAQMEDRFRKIFQEAFGMDARLDYSGLQQFTLRVAKQFPDVPADPRESYPILSKLKAMDEQGDGFRSFSGVVLSVLLAEGRVILLDEPEAFLHPPQARRLGAWVATESAKGDRQIVVATHDSNFIAGVLAVNKPVQILRLNRDNDRTTYHQIPPPISRELSTSPLLSSQRVLEAIFAPGVVVCEADADRAVYQLVATQKLGDQETLFVHSHNKQTLQRVVKALRAAAIPVVVIADIDLLESWSDLETLLKAFGVTETADIRSLQADVVKAVAGRSEDDIVASLTEAVEKFREELEAQKHSLSGARGALNRLRSEVSKWAAIKTKGVDGLGKEGKAAATALLERLKEKGIFVVPLGELESWIDLGTRQKSKWVVAALGEIARGNVPKHLTEFMQEVLASFQRV